MGYCTKSRNGAVERLPKPRDSVWNGLFRYSIQHKQNPAILEQQRSNKINDVIEHNRPFFIQGQSNLDAIVGSALFLPSSFFVIE
mmetsp:Transcript_19883/g.21318  ORF Transcript_19883/g.21318 Transcript_19883/m.21318 type:complete len:85 (+) Transcript_19883:417-671(+)